MTDAYRHRPADHTLSAGRSPFGQVHTTGSGPSSGRHGRAGSGSGIVLMPSTVDTAPTASPTALQSHPPEGVPDQAVRALAVERRPPALASGPTVGSCAWTGPTCRTGWRTAPSAAGCTRAWS